MAAAALAAAASPETLPDSGGSSTLRAVSFTTLAMLAFAGNSVLCRLALRDGTIDPATFTAVRLAAGAITLWLIFRVTRRGESVRKHGGWLSAGALFAYAICFSYAYISLSTGAGALILFGFVQATMIMIGLWSGDRPGAAEWAGWTIAFAGLVWLLLPGVEAPSAIGATLMAAAGVAWGFYSSRGRRESDALASTASNFLLSLAFVAVVVALTIADAEIRVTGLILAITSGALTSGIGYVIWYAALEYLSAMQAALVQLSVPAIAAAGGVLLLDETLTLRLLVSSVLVLGGICLALVRKSRAA